MSTKRLIKLYMIVSIIVILAMNGVMIYQTRRINLIYRDVNTTQLDDISNKLDDIQNDSYGTTSDLDQMKDDISSIQSQVQDLTFRY